MAENAEAWAKTANSCQEATRARWRVPPILWRRIQFSDVLSRTPRSIFDKRQREHADVIAAAGFVSPRRTISGSTAQLDESGRMLMNVGGAIVGSVIGGALGGALWVGIGYATGYELGILAIIVGAACGIGAAMGTKGHAGVGGGLIAAIIALVSIM